MSGKFWASWSMELSSKLWSQDPAVTSTLGEVPDFPVSAAPRALGFSDSSPALVLTTTEGFLAHWKS